MCIFLSGNSCESEKCLHTKLHPHPWLTSSGTFYFTDLLHLRSPPCPAFYQCQYFMRHLDIRGTPCKFLVEHLKIFKRLWQNRQCISGQSLHVSRSSEGHRPKVCEQPPNVWVPEKGADLLWRTEAGKWEDRGSLDKKIYSVVELNTLPTAPHVFHSRVYWILHK